MKRIAFQIALSAIILFAVNKAIAQNTVFLTEDFEACSGTNKPERWSEVRVSGDYFWRYQNGGGATTTTPEFKHPSAAHSGTVNAVFQIEGTGPTSRLITPAMDLRFSIKPVLSFWLAMDEWDFNTDELKVSYRTSITAPWTPLQTYLTTLMEWQKKELVLPPEAKVQNCQIAFEAKSNYGWGICLDDVLIDERGNVPRTVSSVNTYQVKDNLPSGTESNPIAFIEIIVGGNTNNLYLTDANLTYTGTSISDVTNFKLFYTRDSVFANATSVPLTALPPSGNNIQFTGGQQVLATGTNYIWVCADIATGAVHGNTVDINVPANSLTIGGNAFPSITQSPSGNCKIEESIGTAYGFETAGGWSLNNSWAIGIPLGGGLNDPTSAYAGQKVMATDLNGSYPPNIVEASAHRATLNAINAKYYQNLFVRYKRWLNVESSDKARVWLSTDGGANWNILMDNNGNTILDRYWKSISHDIGTQATRKESVMVRFAIDESDVSFEYGGWNIDNFAITGDFIAKDLGVSGIVLPTQQCGLKSDEIVRIKIKNYGGATVNPPFNVGFSLDNGATYTTETVNDVVPFEGEIEYQFSARANLTSPGLKQFKFKTFLTGDEDTKNDSYSTTLYSFPSPNYIYTNSFETSNGHWYPTGTNSTWAWGIVAKGTINKASNGTKVWTTGGLKSTYNNSELSYLESPCFDFSLAEFPVFSFDYFINAENEKDGLRLEYKIEGETGWAQVNSDPNHTLNWSNTSVLALGTVGWTGITATDYQTARTLLPLSVLGKSNVKFRFVFASDPNNNLEGVAIDNIKIYELPYDVGIKRLVSPTSGCYIGNNVQLIAKVTNHGYRPLKSGLKIPIEVKLRNENVVKDTLLIGALVPSQDSTTFTSNETFNIFTKGAHAIRLNTNITPELDRSNDTLKTTLQIKGIPGYSIGPDKAVPIDSLTPGVRLDAGLNASALYNSYLWSSIPPLSPLVAPVNTKAIRVYQYGFYTVSVTNENGCEAKDTIEVIESTSDVTILSSTGLTDACTYPASVKPTISIKNLGPNTIGPISTVTKKIPLSIKVNGVVMVSEDFEPSADILKDETVDYTFVNGIDLSTPGEYNISIYSKINEDPEKTNDTLKVTTNVWGLPKINFPSDTIVSINATSIVLDAGAGFEKYLWTPGTPIDTLQTFTVPSNNSAWYYATVTAFHSCGTDTKGVYINAKDLSVISIQNPTPSFCDNENPVLAVVINNSGRDDFATNEKITISYNTPDENVSKEFTLLTPLPSGNSKAFYFDNPVKLPSGEGYINVTANIKDDPTSSNNTLERAFEKRPSPTIDFDPAIISRVFGGSPYTISPIHSNNVRSFDWKDALWAHLTFDSVYTIYDTPPSRTLNVIAYEGPDQLGCCDTATLTITADDIAIDEIKSPTNMCELGNNTPVSITIANKGNFTYTNGTQFTIDVDVDGVHKFTESFDLNSDLAPNAKRDISITNTLALLGKTSATIQVSISTAQDVVLDNNFLNKTVYTTGYPSVNLGSDRIVHQWKDTLRTGTNFLTYEWLFNGSAVGSDSTYIATESGTYKVNVVDYNGCPGTSNQITLTFVVDDISLKTLDKPQTGCGLTLTEPVRVTVENTGSEVITSGKQLSIGFRQIAPPNTTIATGTQNFILSSNLTAGQTRTFDLTNTMSFPNNIEYSVKAWVKTAGDMRSNNDTLFTTVRSYPAMLYNQFNVDTIETSNANTILDAGVGFNSYQWNTGATTQTIDVTASGKYIAEVTNSDGCKGKDSVYVKFLHDLSVESLVTPAPINCALSNSQTITVRLKNEGTNTIHSGEVIPLTLKKDETLVASENLVLSSDLLMGNTVDYTFIYKPDLSAADDYLLELTLKLKEDIVSSNNTKTFSIRVQGAPTPNLGVDRIISTPTILDAGAGHPSYLWSTGAQTQTITVSASGTYSVTVTDANNCTGFDEVIITWQENVDVQATALVSPLASPSSNCYESDGQTVTATLKNLGSSTLITGQNIDVSYQINTNTPVVQTLTLTSDFATNQTKNFTFNQKADLNPGTYTFYIKTIINTVSGTVNNYPVIINANPVFSFQEHIVKTTLPYTISSNISNVNYLWSTDSPNASITVSSYGKYWLRVSDKITGCSTTDTISIENGTSVGTIPGSNAKVTYFPNPVNNELTIKIETDKNEAFTIDLVNPSGQVVKNLKTEKTLFYSDKIDVKNYTPGLYLLKVSNDKGNTVFKVIVQR